MNFEETETKVLKRKRENSLNDMTLNESSVDSVEEINSNTSIASQWSNQQPKTILGFLDKMPLNDQKRAEELLAKAIFSSGIYV